MSNPDQLYREVELELSRDDGLDLIVLLDESAPLPNCSGYYEILYTNPEDEDWPATETTGEGEPPAPETNKEPARFFNDDRTKIVLYFPAEEITCVAGLELLLAARDITDYRVNEKFLERNDYLENYKEYYHPIPVGERLVIIPSWHRGTAKEAEFLNANSLPIYLDPGLAFGTGKHPTTRMCLARMEHIHLADAKVLDAGCGSGVLSLGALLLGATEAIGFDVDGNAIQATNQNLEHQPEFTGKLQVLKGGFELPVVTEYPADLLVGNLTETVILSNRNAIRGGRYRRMLFSGILSEQGDSIVECFADEWRLVHREDLEGWCLLELEKE